MKAIIKDRQAIAKDTLHIKFDLLGREVNFKAGQYFYITVPKLLYPDKRGNLRHFTIVSPPSENKTIAMATRIREKSGFKRTLRDLPIGSEVEIGSIMGDFVLPENEIKQLVFIAGGIGITPFMSMLAHINEKSLFYEVIVICSNRTKESTPFYNDLQKFERINKKIKLVFVMTEKAATGGEKGRIDAKFIKRYVPKYEKKLFYIAGPPGFNKAVLEILKELKIKNIRIENFRGYRKT